MTTTTKVEAMTRATKRPSSNRFPSTKKRSPKKRRSPTKPTTSKERMTTPRGRMTAATRSAWRRPTKPTSLVQRRLARRGRARCAARRNSWWRRAEPTVATEPSAARTRWSARRRAAKPLREFSAKRLRVLAVGQFSRLIFPLNVKRLWSFGAILKSERKHDPLAKVEFGCRELSRMRFFVSTAKQVCVDKKNRASQSSALNNWDRSTEIFDGFAY